MTSYPVLLHLPHSSTFIPEDVRGDMILSDADIEKEALKITDRYTDELYKRNNIYIHKNDFSRLVFDPERFRNDDEEAMAAIGMGAIYEKNSEGERLRHLSPQQRSVMIEKYYDPYHKELTNKVDEILSIFGLCTIIDGHSFPDTPLAFEKNKTRARPDICLGTDDYHTPANMVVDIEDFIRERGYSADLNHPFAGSLAPIKHYRKNKKVASIMIEINRKLYMDETSGAKLESFEKTKSFVKELLRFIIERET